MSAVECRVPRREDLLRHAAEQARERGFDRFPIVDVDCHLMERLPDFTPYVDQPWRHTMESATGFGAIMPQDVGIRRISGRAIRPQLRAENGLPDHVYEVLEANRHLGIDYSIIFPTGMLGLGLHPQLDMEVALAFGYARWMRERVLPLAPSIKTMLYLPFGDPDACVRLIEEFAETPGVVGFMVTSVRHQSVNDNAYMKVYAALEERGLPIGFHSAAHWLGTPFRQFNRFISAHALGFPIFNMVHLTNIVMNGIPERFPKLKFIWFEAGVAWLPFLMYRLDSEYMMRSSEAPQLKRKPSEYIKEMYFSTQPIEYPDDLSHLEAMFKMVRAETQFLYSSDYPHWDFDLPSRIYDLPFLSETAKRRILGANAMQLFNLPPVPGQVD